LSGYNDLISLALDELDKLTELDGGRVDNIKAILEQLRPSENKVEVASIYGMLSKQPLVEVRVSKGNDFSLIQWTPQEARRHALQVFEAAEASEQDGFLVSFITERVGGSARDAGRMLQEFRAYRVARRERE
jgi:hypothetical protein